MTLAPPIPSPCGSILQGREPDIQQKPLVVGETRAWRRSAAEMVQVTKGEDR